MESAAVGEVPVDNTTFFEAIGARKEVDNDTSETSSYQSSDDGKPKCTQPPNLGELGETDDVKVSQLTF